MSQSVGRKWQRILEGKRYAPAGDTGFLKRFRGSPYIRIVLRYAQLKPESSILEPGCGSGKFSLVLASLGHHVIALDYVSDILRTVRETERGLGQDWPWRLRGYCNGDLENLPLSDDSFDLVINEGVVEHWLNDAQRMNVLREMVRVTRPLGVVAVIVPNGAHPLVHRWESCASGCLQAPPMTPYSAGRLEKELIQAGLQDVYVEGIYAWRSWVRLPPWDRLYPGAALLDHLIPLPRALNEKWAINVIGLGRK